MLNKLITFIFITVLSYSLSVNAEELPILSGVGGDFVAVNADGKEIEFHDYEGNVVVIAFGYTNCADICPFTLGYLKRLYAALSAEEQQKVKI
ncbi:MAG: redoxin domain-containing protein, partial [Methylophaga sp.]|nr:redoxin domain-containing protein [Methylophaga sp.]